MLRRALARVFVLRARLLTVVERVDVRVLPLERRARLIMKS
jgi:hypothetical protein